MLRDDVGYLRPIESPMDMMRPRAIKWMPVNPEPGALTEIPKGWKLAPYEKWRARYVGPEEKKT
jgi:hypothetical protein